MTTMGSRPGGPTTDLRPLYATVTPRTPGRDGHTPGHAGAGDARILIEHMHTQYFNFFTFYS
jgi:hypothetical protein